MAASSSSPSTPPLTGQQDNATREILYLLDSYGVSDDFYHELSMLHTSLPRSYKVKSLRQSLSSGVDMKRLPNGWYVSFVEYLQLSLRRLIRVLRRISSTVITPTNTCWSRIRVSN